MAETRNVSALPTTAVPEAENANTSTQKAFDALVDEYFKACFDAHPNWATAVGYHDWDNKLETFSADSIHNRIQELKDFNRKFAAIDDNKLDKTSRLDKEMLIANANSE